MKNGQARRVLGLAAVLLAAFAATAQAHFDPAHRLGLTTAPTPYDTIKVTMTDKAFTLSKHSGPMGWDARFVIHNIGKRPHAFDLRASPANLSYESHLNTLVAPGKQKILILYLNRRGIKLHYFGSLPADRRNRAMQGVFTVGPCVNIKEKNQASAAYQICNQVQG